MTGYYKLFGDLPDEDYEGCVSFLEKELRYELTADYENQFRNADVRYFNDTLSHNLQNRMIASV